MAAVASADRMTWGAVFLRPGGLPHCRGDIVYGAAPQLYSCWPLLRQVGGSCASLCSLARQSCGRSRIP